MSDELYENPTAQKRRLVETRRRVNEARAAAGWDPKPSIDEEELERGRLAARIESDISADEEFGL